MFGGAEILCFCSTNNKNSKGVTMNKLFFMILICTLLGIGNDDFQTNIFLYGTAQIKMKFWAESEKKIYINSVTKKVLRSYDSYALKVKNTITQNIKEPRLKQKILHNLTKQHKIEKVRLRIEIERLIRRYM